MNENKRAEVMLCVSYIFTNWRLKMTVRLLRSKRLPAQNYSLQNTTFSYVTARRAFAGSIFRDGEDLKVWLRCRRDQIEYVYMVPR